MSVTNYVWLGENILYETDENDAVTVEYTYEPQQYGRLLSEYRGSTTYTHYYDALGSTLALTDSTGTVTDTFAYNAWGEELARTGSTLSPFRWIGEFGYYYNSELGQCYVRRRIYLPEISRWTAVDPLTRFGNAYAYASQNPIINIDPSGLESFSGGTWSRGGDDEERTYETARISIDINADPKCTNANCKCTGNIHFTLHYHARVGGSPSIGPQSPGRNFGLCVPGEGNTWKSFDTTRIRSPFNQQNSQGYRYFYELTALVDIGDVDCNGGSISLDILVSTKDSCDGVADGRAAEEIHARVFVSECGKISGVAVSLTELPNGEFVNPIRCISCGEGPYPPFVRR